MNEHLEDEMLLSEQEQHDIKSSESITSNKYEDGYIVSVRYISSNRSYYFYTSDDSLRVNDKVVVETVRGLELAVVIGEPKDIREFDLDLELKPVVRRATQEDEENYEINLEKAQEAYKICEECVKQLDLKMRLIKAEYTLDASKVIIIYVADERVDFRELLKELAAKLRCRIELRQIGSRDRSKIVGGIGACGLPLCCSTFLGEFDGISINMAKNQYLALNIQKLSGHCGKLICCLKYEDDEYTRLRQGLPKIGQKLHYDDKIYKIASINVLTGAVRLESPENIINLHLDEVKELIESYKEG
jgi:cell fate regulator YaaT (PSP1 superfamily)